MRSFKDSGIKWVGEIPSDWKICRCSGLFHEHKNKNIGLICTNLLSLSYGKIKKKDINSNEGLLPDSFESYNIISPGDIVFRLTDLQNDHRSLRTGLCTEQGIITSAYLALQKNFELCERYFHYLFHSYDTCKVFYGMGDGIRQGMGWNDLKSLSIIVPPYFEQKQIANFLDLKCADINLVIHKTKSSIEEYKKLKQSIIIEAITKGLRGKRPMKESGISWIGQIPEEWNIGRLSQNTSQVKNKNFALKETNLLSLSYGKVINKSIETTFGLLPDNFEGYNIIESDNIVLRLTDLQNDQKSLRVGISKQKGIITSAYITLSVSNNIFANYLYYHLYAFDICKGFYGLGAGIRQGLNWNELKSLKICWPCITEQKEIASYLDRRCSEIDFLIESKEKFIEEIESYKNSLIQEYVTGKKSVI